MIWWSDFFFILLIFMLAFLHALADLLYFNQIDILKCVYIVYYKGQQKYILSPKKKTENTIIILNTQKQISCILINVGSTFFC